MPVNIYDTTEQNAGFIDILDAKDLTDFIYTCNKCEPGYFKIEQTVTFTTTKQVTINDQTQDHPNKNVNNTFKVIVCKNYQNTFIDSSRCEVHNVDGSTTFDKKAFCKTCKPTYYPEFVQDDRYLCFD